ncbi:M23 family metallopeptidase [Streptacidiphilus sp. 4-A2]|nr:M23 family metallopeptidase [Streptacidiphilus sp. 4-A2]
MPIGTPVRAATAGTVVFAGWGGSYGNLVEIRHADGAYSRYGHLSGFDVRTGESVSAGTTVGRRGHRQCHRPEPALRRRAARPAGHRGRPAGLAGRPRGDPGLTRDPAPRPATRDPRPATPSRPWVLSRWWCRSSCPGPPGRTAPPGWSRSGCGISPPAAPPGPRWTRSPRRPPGGRPGHRPAPPDRAGSVLGRADLDGVALVCTVHGSSIGRGGDCRILSASPPGPAETAATPARCIPCRTGEGPA